MSLALDAFVDDEDYPGMAQKKTMKDYLIFWMNSIHSFVGSLDGKEPVVILVGTHLDKLKGGKQAADDYFSAVRDLFSESEIRHHIYAKDFPLSLIDSQEDIIEDLRSTIEVIVAKREAEVAIHVPAKWICLEQELQRHKSRNIITFKDLQNINDIVFPIPKENKLEDELKLFLRVKHAQGVYFYFDDGVLAEYVVLNPKFIINAFKCIIKAKKFCQKEEPELVPLWKELSDNAVLKPELMHAVWKKTSDELFESRDVLTLILKKHRIISEVQKYEPGDSEENSQRPQGFYIVPSLLKKSDKGKVVGYLEGKRTSTVALVYAIKCSKIAETIFQRMLAAAIGTWPVLHFRTYRMLFNNAGIFEIDLDHAGLLKLTEEQIEILVIARCFENCIVSGMGDFFRRFVEEVINQEFAKLKKEDQESRAIHSYQIMIRCYHSQHKCEGSTRMYTIHEVYEHDKERVPCPDNLSHSLGKKVIDSDWFKTPTQDEFPKRRLTTKEYSMLSTEIGFGWELLGIRLGLDRTHIDHIIMDNQRSAMRIYEMFLKWDSVCDEEATFDVLVKEMRDLGTHLTVNWDKVYNLRDNFPKLLCM